MASPASHLAMLSEVLSATTRIIGSPRVSRWLSDDQSPSHSSSTGLRSSALPKLREILDDYFAGNEPMLQAFELEMTGPKARYLPPGDGSKVRICQIGLMRTLG